MIVELDSYTEYDGGNVYTIPYVSPEIGIGGFSDRAIIQSVT